MALVCLIQCYYRIEWCQCPPSYTHPSDLGYLYLLPKQCQGLQICVNIQPCFALYDDGDDQTNQFRWLKLQHTSCTFLFKIKQRKLGSINVLKPEHIHPCNFCNKQILKIWTPCLSEFYCVTSHTTFPLSLKACAIARLSKSFYAW